MGDTRLVKMAESGDVIRVDFRDGMYIEAMSLTHHIKQMKLISLVTSAAVIGASFLIPNPANANGTIPFPSPEEVSALKKDLKSRDVYYIKSRKINYNNNSCPPGTKHYRTKGLLGLGARDIGCLTAYEAESLRRQHYRDFENDIQNLQSDTNRNRTRHCTTSFVGRTAYTDCY